MTDSEILALVRAWRKKHAGKRYAYFTDLDVILGGGVPNRPASRDTLLLRAAQELVVTLYNKVDIATVSLIRDLLQKAIDE